MRQVDLKTRRSPGQDIDDWVSREFTNIMEASRDRPEISSVRPFVFNNTAVSPDGKFDLTTDTVVTLDLNDFAALDPAIIALAKAFMTYITYLQKQGPKRT